MHGLRLPEALGLQSAGTVQTDTTYNSAFFAALASAERKYTGSKEVMEGRGATPVNSNAPGTIHDAMESEFKTPKMSSSFARDHYPQGKMMELYLILIGLSRKSMLQIVVDLVLFRHQFARKPAADELLLPNVDI